MPSLTLHFEADHDADLSAATAELKEKASAIPEVEVSQAQPMHYRTIGPSEILLALTVAGAVLQGTTTAVKDLTALLDSLKALAQSAKGVKQAFLEVGLKKIPVEQLTVQDLQKAAKA